MASVVIVGLFMTDFYTSPCSSEHIITFVSGARGRIILSSPPARYTFRIPWLAPTYAAWLGIVYYRVSPNSPNFLVMLGHMASIAERLPITRLIPELMVLGELFDVVSVEHHSVTAVATNTSVLNATRLTPMVGGF
jgi:hypothetical protein